ncbi:Hypothetical Protein FCC1311_008122 [Hondaea fermentalgiana]|uniref:Thioredoxin domain-containing protein n=1 Tax=Hondaea fermentalgiana TaxID=2315210 RepID=A0A2R5G7Y1_9STRA|nr:Hypothetical Protein FCC1311_008122 [Hondaea fermentalgiana]|eukprot:GBG24593.1 Hypothetical Protein FCC1311_008122 [Hondaea fermentalgiana]
MVRRSVRAATLAKMAIASLLCAVVAASEEAAAAAAGADAAAEAGTTDAALVQSLTGEDLDSQVYRSREAWAVLVTASQGCPQCQTLEALLETTARSSNGLAKFATVDVLDAANVKALGGNLAQLGLPQLRLYVEPGQRNAYKKDEFYREFHMYSGHDNARAIKRFLQDAILKEAPVEVVTGANFSQWAEQVQDSGKGGALMLSTKKQPSATVAALARLAQGASIPVAQYSNFEAGSEEASTVEAIIGGAGEGVPRLAAFKPSEKTWVSLDLSTGKSTGLQDLANFLEADAGLDLLRSGAGESRQGGKAGSSGQAEDQAKSNALASGLVTSLAQLRDEVLSQKMPIVLAARVSGNAQTPPDWDKLRAKSHGVTMVQVHCDSLKEKEGAEHASATEALCPPADAKDLLHEEGSAWAVTEWDFVRKSSASDDEDEDLRGFDSGARTDSLTEARSKALASIPDVVMKLPDGSMLQNFISMAVQSHLLPVVLLGNKPDPPAMLVSAAAAAEGLALIAYRANPSADELQTSFGMPLGISVPQLVAIGTEKVPGKDELRMMISLYDRQAYGKFSYQRMLGFMIQVAQMTKDEDAQRALHAWVRTHGVSLGVRIQGEETGEETLSQTESFQSETGASGPLDDASKDMAVISSAEDWARLCPEDGSSPQLLCAIGFLDGNPLNADLDMQKALLQGSREKLLGTPSGAAKLRFMWVDATCHESFLSGFQMDASGLPTLGVYHPRKRIFFRMFQGLSAANAEKFLISIASGFGKNSETLDARPGFGENVDCASLPSRASTSGHSGAANEASMEGDEDEDEDDFLAEIRAEEEAERKRRKLEVKAEMELLKEEKRKKAEQEKKEAEAEAAAASAAKARRRRRRRRRKAAKDEL